MTSHDVVSTVRRATGEKRVGHAGTLDPFATGLLVVLTGRGTRLIPYLDAEPKHYSATVRFGAETDTDDATGTVTREAPSPSPEAVDAAIAALTGDLEQVPPAYSAKQVNGVRAYAAARRGRPLELKPARVRVHAWDIQARRANELDVSITCSGGTYIRALARDLGRLTHSAAHLAALRREQAGAFHVQDAVPLAALEHGAVPLRPLRDAVRHLPAQAVDEAQAARIAHGNTVPVAVAGDHAALVRADELVAVAVREGDAWRPRVVLRDP
jgi:tRNA pseudouridine55 synthase